MKFPTRIAALAFLLALFLGSSRAQIVGTVAYMENNFVEVGVNQCGAYGTPTAAGIPPTYNPNSSYGLGFNADQGKNGYLTAGPGALPRFCGDYFLPGSPVEGWSLTFNGTDYINSNNGGICSPTGVPGSIQRYVNTTCIDSIIWVGNVSGMRVRQITTLIEDSLFFLTKITLRNTTGATMNNVFYARNVDPDNDVLWPGGSFTTTNVILKNNTPVVDPCKDAVVTATGPLGCYVALGARDARARVSYGSFFTDAADDTWNGVARTQTPVGVTSVGDIGIQVAFNLGNIAAGDSVEFTLIYALNPNSLAGALTASGGFGGFVIGGVTYPSGGSLQICPGQSIAINLSLSAGSGGGGPCGGVVAGTLDTNKITWRPGATLSDTIGLHVIASPDTTTTYMVIVDDTISVLPCVPGTGIRDTLYITVEVIPVLVDAGPDTATCSNVGVTIGSPGLAGYTYSWSPATGLSSTSAAQPIVTIFNPGPAPIYQQYVIAATNPLGCVAYDTVTVTIGPPPASTFVTADSICFGDNSIVTFTGIPTPFTTYTWDFGAGTIVAGTGAGPYTISWPAPGSYSISLLVVTAGCSSNVTIDTITVLPIPTAVINPVANQCVSGNSFDFTQAGTYGPAATFIWRFFPGATPLTSTAENPTGITFSAPGIKYATLQVNEYGCLSTIDTISFEVYPTPPADFTILSPAACFDGNAFDFSHNGGAGPTATYSWTFQNGIPSTSALPNPTGVTFTSSGLNLVTLTVTENGCSDSTSQYVTVYPNPVVDAGMTVSFCEGEGGDTLFATMIGAGSAPYYYTWWCDNPICGIDSVHDDDPLVNPTGLPTGCYTYYVQVVDNNGCISNIDSVEVCILPKPVVNAGPDIYLCGDSGAPGAIINATVSGAPGPYYYQWYPSTGLNNDTILNPYARPDTTTVYYLIVTSSNGCTSNYTVTDTAASVTVFVYPVPTANAGSDEHICIGDTVQLTGIGGGAGPGYTYEWSPSVGLSNPNIINPMAFPSITTTYTFTVWSNGCPSYADSITVYVHTQPTAEAGPNRGICQGGSVMLDGEAGGDPFSSFYTYRWSPGASLNDSTVENPMASPDTTTMYYLFVESEYGCGSAIDSVLVTVLPTPIADAGPTRVICAGDSTQLAGWYTYDGTVPVSDTTLIFYSWTPTTGLSDASVRQPMASPAVTTWYYLTITTGSCSTTDSVLVTVVPALNSAIGADTTTICSGQSTVLHVTGGSGGATFLWSPSTGLSCTTCPDPVANPTDTTTYTVIVSQGGCSDTLRITLNVIPSPEMAYVSSATEGCVPFSVSFMESVANAVSYSWNFGDGSPVDNGRTPTHTYTQPGTYTVTLTATNTGGCSGTISTITITVSDTADAEFTSDPMYPAELSLPSTTVKFTNQSRNAVTYLWSFGDGQTSTERDPEHMYTAAGTYYVTLTVTNGNGCTSTVTHGPYIIKTPDLFIPNVFSPNGDGIGDTFWANYTGSQPFSMTITDRWGVQLYTTQDKYAGWDGTKNGAEMPEGVYYYVIKIADKAYTGNVTLMR